MTPPRWMTFIIIVFTLPLFSTPWLVRTCPPGQETVKTLIQLYPFYMALSAWLAYKAYPQRHYVSWLLLLMMALSTAAIFILTKS